MPGGCHSPPIDYQTLATKWRYGYICFPADGQLLKSVRGVRVRAHGKEIELGETVVAYVTYVKDLTSRTWSPFVIRLGVRVPGIRHTRVRRNAFSSFRRIN
jgi:hypothetical protein